jgi:hypothetical protein
MSKDKEIKAIYDLTVQGFNLRQRLVDKVVALLITTIPELHNDTEIIGLLKNMREVQTRLEVLQSVIDKKEKNED